MLARPVIAGAGLGFNPATDLTLTGYWRADYSASPWTDSSGNSRNLTSGSAPTTGSTVNGWTPSRWDGIATILAGTNITTFFGASGSFWALFYASSAPAPVSAYADGSIFGDPGNGECNFGFTSSGFGACVLDNSVTYQRIDVACGTGAWHLGQAKWNGSNLYARIDSNSWSSMACGPFTTIAATTAQAGSSYLNNIRFTGDILEMGCASSALTDDNFESIRQYVNQRYALAL